MKPVNRLYVLQTIFEHFQQITQWIPQHYDSAAEYESKADALIELLEVADCGSVLAFYIKEREVTGHLLYDRFLALLRKYHKDKDIKSVCGFTVKSLGNYFKQQIGMRNKMLGGK